MEFVSYVVEKYSDIYTVDSGGTTLITEVKNNNRMIN
jgi:hypothetical protein